MGLLDGSLQQVKIWKASLRLGSPIKEEREAAMETLRQAGNASLPCLRYALAPYHPPRTQYAAAVVLHQLGDPEGLTALKESMLWRLPTAPAAFAPELENAYIAIGSPDAVTSLLHLCEQNADWSDANPILQSVCKVFATLKDPRAIEVLIPHATRIPELFEQTIPAFGEMAVLHLERMARHPDVAARCLAVQTLRHIVRASSFQALAPLLRDAHPQARGLVPQALLKVGSEAASARAINDALFAGYSSPEAIETLAGLNQINYDALLALIERWNPATLTPAGDSGAAVLAALPFIASSALPNRLRIPALCGLLERNPGPALAAEAARVIGLCGQSSPTLDHQTRSVLMRQLTHPDSQVREATAAALLILGEPLGRELNRLLAECRPQGSLLTKFHAILRGGPEAGQAANQAMQQLTQWVSRVSKEAAERLATGAQEIPLPASDDPRLVPLLCDLLTQTLERLSRATDPAENEELVTQCVTAARAFARLGAPRALPARDVLVRALRTTKRSAVYAGATATPFGKMEMRDIGGLARTAAAEALHQLYGAHVYPLYLEALYAPLAESRGTAISALGNLGDARAVPHLQAIASDPMNPYSLAAQEAIAQIKRTHPEMMTLLRASTGTELRPETLLRPASHGPLDTQPELLLRPTASQPNESAG